MSGESSNRCAAENRGETARSNDRCGIFRTSKRSFPGFRTTTGHGRIYLPANASVTVGTRSALRSDAVTRLRIRIAALAIIAGLLTGASASALAGGRNAVCVAKQHDCGKTARITSCCCGDAGAQDDASTPAQSRVETTPAVVATAVLPLFVDIVPATHPAPAVHTSPPGMWLVDLPTLFATLLI